MNNPQEKDLVDSISSEVSKEASPLFSFLIRNAGKIVAIAIVLIIAALGYGFYTQHQGKASTKEKRALGQVLIVQELPARYEALTNYLNTATGITRNEALFALAETATALEHFDKAYEAWDEIGKNDKNILVIATFGKGSALVNQNKTKEAQALYESVLPQTKSVDQYIINKEIATLAELNGDYQRAITACQALLTNPAGSDDIKNWQMKIEALKLKVPSTAPSTNATGTSTAPQSGKQGAK